MGQYGNAILSRHPLTDVQDLELTIPLKKRRRALIAHCRLRVTRMSARCCCSTFISAWPGLNGPSNSGGLLASDVLRHTRHDTGVIVAGDYNDVWGTLGRRLLEPAGFKAACFRRKTFPAVLPIRSLDRVYYRGALEVHHSFASAHGRRPPSLRSSAAGGRLSAEH